MPCFSPAPRVRTWVLGWPISGCLAILFGCSSGDSGPIGSGGAAAGVSMGVGGASTSSVATSAGGSAGATSTGATTTGGGGSAGGGGAAGSFLDAGPDATDADATASTDAGRDGTNGTPGPAIDLSPSELVFSALLGMKSDERVLTVRNLGTSALDVASFTFRTPGGPFAAVMPPVTPVHIAPGGEAALRVVYSPPAGGTPGVEQGGLRIASNDPDEGMLEVALWALSTRAAQGANEPPLAQIVEALGYAIDVGGKNLVLGTGASPIGDEVRAQRFRRAAPGAVTLRPVARYSPDEPVPYGYYTRAGAAPMTTKVAAMRMGQEQTLLPGVEPGSQSEFDPGDVPFGLYGTANNRTTYTEDALNMVGPMHAVRSYPLKDRAGRPVANAYLVCFEEAANGDYNDYVFVMGNAMPAP